MKSERRHELQQDELSVQIEKVSESVKQNATLVTAIVAGVVVIATGSIYFFNQRANAQHEAFGKLSMMDMPSEDVDMELAQYRQVARDNVSKPITISAWLRLGDRAMEEVFANRSETEARDEAAQKKYLDEAEEAFKAVAGIAGNDLTAYGRAVMGLGVVAESRGDFDAAKAQYKKIVDDNRFKHTPLPAEAKYRIENLDKWSNPIEFPLPQVAEIEETNPEATFQPVHIDTTTDDADDLMKEVETDDASGDGTSVDETSDEGTSDETASDESPEE